MTQTPAPIEQARQLLAEPVARPRLLEALLAASFAALAACLMAGAVILGPGAEAPSATEIS